MTTSFEINKSIKGKTLKISPNGHYFQFSDGKPFFYLGDTAWSLFKRLKKEDLDVYLNNRARKGFNVIQTYFLRGLNIENPYGQLPLIDNDPAKPNERYYENVDYIVDKANEMGFVIGGVVTWGVHVQEDYGDHKFPGERVFNKKNAAIYGEFLGKRYKDNCVIWYLGGDKEPLDNKDVWIALAEGLKRGSEGRHLVSYHGPGAPNGLPSSSVWFHEEPWLDFNALQTGHTWSVNNYDFISHDYSLIPAKPVLDIEASYENHIDVGKTINRRIDEHQVRESMYWQVLAGAAGHGYGCNDIWGFWDENNMAEQSDYSYSGEYFRNTNWKVALDFSGATCVGFARRLFELRPWYLLVPDQSVIAVGQGEGENHTQAARANDGSFLITYSTFGNQFGIDMSSINGERIIAQWFNPRDGKTIYIGHYPNRGIQIFSPPTNYDKDDWVLVLDDEGRKLPLL